MGQWFISAWQDARFALRTFNRNRAFVCISVTTLALGIGIASAIFSLAYAVLVRPFIYRDSSRLVLACPGPDYTIPDYLQLRTGMKTISGAFYYRDTSSSVTAALPEPVIVTSFSPNAFTVLGVPALIGRVFAESDTNELAAPPHIVVLRYEFWLRMFGGDKNVIGRNLRLNHQSYTIVGIMPPRFSWEDADVYTPLAMTSRNHPQGGWTIFRLKPGVQLSETNAELSTFNARFAKANPNWHYSPANIRRLVDARVGDFHNALITLGLAVGFLLIIACCNLSILLLARANSRRGEIATRITLGALKSRVLRQLLTESVMLSMAGGALGALLAYGGLPLLLSLVPNGLIPPEVAVSINGPVLIAMLAVSITTGIIFGVIPAWRLARVDLNTAMRDVGRGSGTSVRTKNSWNALIVAQIAMALILLAGAGVAAHGFARLVDMPLGYDARNVLVFPLNLNPEIYRSWSSAKIFNQTLLETIRNIPGVAGVAETVNAVPPHIRFYVPFTLQGRNPQPEDNVCFGLISADYFSTLHIPSVAGRLFSGSEDRRSTHVAVINEAFAHEFLPVGANPIGLTIKIPLIEPWENSSVPPFTDPSNNSEFQIIGVVADSRDRGLTEPTKPAVYVPMNAFLEGSMNLIVRSEANPSALVSTVRHEVASIDSNQTFGPIMTLEDKLAVEDWSYPRFNAALFSTFGLAALLIAGVGIFSGISYAVSQRTREFGIRMALGASRGNVLGLAVWSVGRLVLIGVLLGIIGSFAGARVLAAHVYGWNVHDPAAIIAVCALFLGIAAVASWIPARKAATIQPAVTLRRE